MAMYMTLRTNDLGAATTAHPNGVLPSRSIGNYVTYQNYDGQGIREYPYSISTTTNPATFGYVKRPDYSETHSVGFVWCSMLYELLQSCIDKYGMNNDVYNGANPTATKNPPATAKGNNIAMRLIIEGMKLQPTSPTFVEERNAILKADTLLYNGQNSCMIWKAFAKRGLGFSAVSGSNALGDEVEAFDLPFTCDPTQKRVRITKSGPVKANNNSPITYTIKVTNKYSTAANGVVITDTLPAGLTFTSGNPAPAVAGNVVKWTMNFAANETKTFTVSAQVALANASTQKYGENHDGATTPFTAQNNGGIGNWTLTSNVDQAFSGSKYWFVPDVDLGGANSTLRTNTPISIPANAELVFIHKYATEEGYDGGVVEVSTDNVNWTYIPPTDFVKNGYSSVIPTANNPGIGTADLASFSGASEGYIVSVAKLTAFANKSIYIRFRFTSDAAGGSVTNGGWWLDDVYVLTNRTEVNNTATAITGTGAVFPTEGANANARTNAFILSSAILANDLGPLTATAGRNSVELKWQSFVEQDVEGYVIERKGRNDENFGKVGNVTAAGNSTAARKYNYTDGTVQTGNRYQYRVKQVRRNGDISYTNIALVDLGSKAFNVSIYPNPTESVANISIVNPAKGKVTVNLFDALGKKLATLNGSLSESQVIALPVQGLKPGTYYIEVNTEEEHSTMSFVKK